MYFSDIAVHCESGGIASIVNSNANFGDICLLARGYGKRKFSGTIYNPGFTTIGAHQVGVPTHVWKVIIDKNGSKGIAFLFPNAAIPVTDLPKYAVSIADIEKYTGINFMPQLTPEQQVKVEQTISVIDWLGL